MKYAGLPWHELLWRIPLLVILFPFALIWIGLMWLFTKVANVFSLPPDASP